MWPIAAEENFTIYHSQVLSRILRCSPICVLEDQETSRELASPMKLPLTQNQRKYYRQTSGHCCLTHFDYVQEVKYFFQYVPSQKYWNEICGILWSRVMQGNQQILLWQCSVWHENVYLAEPFMHLPYFTIPFYKEYHHLGLPNEAPSLLSLNSMLEMC